MSTTTKNESNRLTLETPKPRNKRLHEVLSGRKGGRMKDKRKERAAIKQDVLRGDLQ